MVCFLRDINMSNARECTTDVLMIIMQRTGVIIYPPVYCQQVDLAPYI